MNGCRGGSAAATGFWPAGAPMNTGSVAASGPSGIGDGGTARAGAASTPSPIATITSTPRTASIVRARSVRACR